MTQRRNILTVALFLAAVTVSTAASVPAARRPNILLIVSDDQGYNDLGVAGNHEIKTPNLDRLASQGVRLTSFYVATSFCTPSRAALLTGRYPQRNGTYDLFRNDRVDDGYLYKHWEYELSPERILGMDTREVLISDLLRKAGYRNGMFGKWDLGSLHRFLPLQRGFDDFYGFVNTGIDYWTHERYGIPSMYRNNEPTTEDKGTYATYLFEREALRFIDEQHEKPFFMYLAFNAPHSASSLDRAIRGAPQAPGKYLNMYLQGDGKRAAVRRKYMASVTAMDDSIGKVLDRIDHYGLTEDTVVIFLSDNGGGVGSDNAPLRGHKAQMWEGGVRVPCIIRWPGHFPEGVTNDEFLTALDLFPMMLAVAGVESPADVVLDGFDMMPVVAGKQSSPRKEMFWEAREEYAARVGNWKWVRSRHGGGLFDLSEDIGEQHDLSQKMPEVARRVKARFAAWRERMKQAAPRGPFRNY